MHSEQEEANVLVNMYVRKSLAPDARVLSLASACLEDTAEADEPSPMNIGETPQRPKIGVQRKENILTPISNGSTPVRVRAHHI